MLSLRSDVIYKYMMKINIKNFTQPFFVAAIEARLLKQILGSFCCVGFSLVCAGGGLEVKGDDGTFLISLFYFIYLFVCEL